jgi:PAS domain S-box-containing protein
LTITISIVVVSAIVVLAWAADNQIEASLIRAGGDRAQAVSAQLASLLERSMQQNRQDLHATVARSELRVLLQNPSDTEAADVVRAQFMSGPIEGLRRVEIWTEAGSRILEVTRAAPGVDTTVALPELSRPINLGLFPLQSANDVVLTELVDEVRSGGTPQGQRLGFVVVRGTLSVNPPGILARLVGPDALVLLGNKTGDVWTDLAHVVPAPPIDLNRPGTVEYRRSDGQARLGALAEIRDTPWAVWVEFPRGVVVAPAAAFLGRMAGIGLLVVGLSALLVRTVTRRLTTPLTALTDAAEAIAAGDYARRTPNSHRQDEVGRLGDAFNVMAEHVEATHQGLEARVSERTTAIEALQSSEARYRAIVELAFDCVITIDEHGIVTEFNPAAERTFGYGRDKAVGRELATLIIPPSLREAHRRGLAHYLETGIGPVIGKLIEIAAMRADGTEFPAELAITAIESVGPARMFTGVVRDITRRKQSEAALVESERAFRSTFDDAPLGIAQVSIEGRWLRVNRYLASVLGYQADDLCGEPFLDIFHPDDTPMELMTEADRPGDREERVRRKDGQSLWVRLTISALRDASGTPRHFIVIIEDVSERRRLEDRLRQSQKMEAIGQLAGGVAHDFNNLLTAILGYAQLVADALDPDDPKRRDVEEIVKAAERSAALTGQLLAFSRKQVLLPTILNLNALIENTSVMLRRLIGEHIDLTTRLAPDLAPVSADVTQIEQIVINLAVNARDAMPSGGRLTIETENTELDGTPGTHPATPEAGRYVMLVVSDTGVGMDAETQRRLFEPFFTTKEPGLGTGLGLATVYGIVKQSGGFIWVYSEPGHGATFKVYLPASSGTVTATPRRTASVPKHEGTETILVVEDERAVRVMTRVILERSGYHVIEAATPDEARRLFREHAETIDLLITDVVMPGSHGPALYKQLVEHHGPLKVLYMSGYTDDEIIHAGRLERGVNFIEKPFTAQKLTEKIREILDR